MNIKKILLTLAGVCMCISLPAQSTSVWAAESDIEQSRTDTESVSVEDMSDTVAVLDESADMDEIAEQVEFALEAADVSVSLETSNGNIVVALDPGHDAGHIGAAANGVKEEVATLKIAQYCKAELESYGGVSVYMTRTTAACPYPETVGATGGNLLDIDKRINAAKQHGADAFVSIHLNSSDSYTANGAEVFYHTHSQEAKTLAEKIEARLVALGLKNRGAKANPEYRVMIDCYREKIPGVIVEHAFMTNISDAKTYLSTEEQLKKLGIADATGIANYFKLSKNKRWANYNEDTDQWICYNNGKPDYTYTGMVNSEDGLIYVKNGISDFTYTGIAANGSLLVYVTNGKPDSKYTGFVKNGKDWMYVKNGEVETDSEDVIKGTVNGTDGWWYVVNGKVSFTETVAKNSNGWWYINNGKVDFSHYGVEKNQNGWWRIEEGKVNFNYKGFAENKNGWWYLSGGKVQFDTNGLIQGTVKGKSGQWNVSGGKIQFADDVVKNGSTWWYVKEGIVDKTHYGVEKNKNGWWRIEAGKVNFGYRGFAENQNGWWYLSGGKVQFGTNGLIQGTVKGKSGQWNVSGGKIQFSDDVVKNGSTWWYVKDGMVDNTHYGVEKNKNGWWRIEAGKVNFSYRGFAKNQNGWWYLSGGKVQFGTNDVIKGTVNGTDAWWYVKNGKVTFEDTVAKNSNGWWRIENGRVNFAFRGMAENQYGWWYLSGGKVDFNYNGTVSENNVTYNVKNGKVDRSTVSEIAGTGSTDHSGVKVTTEIPQDVLQEVTEQDEMTVTDSVSDIAADTEDDTSIEAETAQAE